MSFDRLIGRLHARRKLTIPHSINFIGSGVVFHVLVAINPSMDLTQHDIGV